jgi:hypothetical protein
MKIAYTQKMGPAFWGEARHYRSLKTWVDAMDPELGDVSWLDLITVCARFPKISEGIMP